MDKRIISIGSTITLVLMFISFHYTDILSEPNNHLFAEEGDGIKNYYTYAYHIAHDSDMVHFEGMHYPYGDHISYTDGNPLLANSLKLLQEIIPWISERIIGIYNLTMILSMIIGGVFISLILSELKVDGWLNGVASLGIVALNPQVQRMTGHFTLSYSWVIPMAILIFLWLRRWQRIKALSVLSVALIFTSFFLHPYLGLLASLTLFIPSIIELVLDPFRRNRRALISSMVGLIPILLYGLFMKVSDPFSGRTTLPWGFYEFYAELETVFIPHTGPLHNLLKYLSEISGIAFPHQTWDGLAYIGVSSILILIWAAVRFFRRMMPKVPTYWIAMMMASTLLLVLAFCIPFRWGGVFNILAENLGPLRQFRGLGRFAWPFYYVITISSLVFVVRQSHRLRGVSGWALPLLASALMVVESWENHVNVSKNISNEGNAFRIESSEQNSVNLSDHQAILTLPFFHIGSDYFIKEVHNGIDKASMLLSYHTGLPLMSSMMTRTSIPQTLEQVQFYQTGSARRSFLIEDQRRPFLVLSSREDCSVEESFFLDGSEHVGEYDGFALSRLEPIRILMEIADDSLVHSNSSAIAYRALEDDHLVFLRKGIHRVYKPKQGLIQEGAQYNLSCWIKGNGNNNSGILIASEQDPISREKKWTHINGVNRFKAVDGQWILATLDFKKSNSGELEFLWMGPWYSRDEVVIRDILIRPANENVYEEREAEAWKNNVPVISSE